MDILMFKFKGFIGFVMILLLTQQSFTALISMNCADTNGSHAMMQTHNLQVTSPMNMLDHNSQSNVKMGSHEKCNVCDASDCRCNEFTQCLGATLSIVAQVINLDYVLFVSHGKRFISSDEYPDPGNYLHPFRPPILI